MQITVSVFLIKCFFIYVFVINYADYTLWFDCSQGFNRQLEHQAKVGQDLRRGARAWWRGTL